MHQRRGRGFDKPSRADFHGLACRLPQAVLVRDAQLTGGADSVGAGGRRHRLEVTVGAAWIQKQAGGRVYCATVANRAVACRASPCARWRRGQHLDGACGAVQDWLTAGLVRQILIVGYAIARSTNPGGGGVRIHHGVRPPPANKLGIQTTGLPGGILVGILRAPSAGRQGVQVLVNKARVAQLAHCVARRSCGNELKAARHANGDIGAHPISSGRKRGSCVLPGELAHGGRAAHAIRGRRGHRRGILSFGVAHGQR
jgi:hypothetical protein